MDAGKDVGLGDANTGRTQPPLMAEVDPTTSKGKTSEPGTSEVGV